MGRVPELIIRIMQKCLLVAFFAVLVGPAFGHPHVFIDTRVEVVFDARGLSGLWITWRFDKMFTAGILMDFDEDGNRRLSAAEVVAVQEGASSNLVHYHYFVYVRSSMGVYSPQSVRDFCAYMEEERVHYRFFIPYSLPIGKEREEVYLAVYDETFYCDIGYDEPAAVMFSASQEFQGSYEIREDRGIRIDYPATDGSQAWTCPRQIVLHLQPAA